MPVLPLLKKQTSAEWQAESIVPQKAELFNPPGQNPNWGSALEDLLFSLNRKKYHRKLNTYTTSQNFGHVFLIWMVFLSFSWPFTL